MEISSCKVGQSFDMATFLMSFLSSYPGTPVLGQRNTNAFPGQTFKLQIVSHCITLRKEKFTLYSVLHSPPLELVSRLHWQGKLAGRLTRSNKQIHVVWSSTLNMACCSSSKFLVLAQINGSAIPEEKTLC